MECEIKDIKEAHELLGLISHYAIRASHQALHGDIESAEQEMQHAIDLLKSTES